MMLGVSGLMGSSGDGAAAAAAAAAGGDAHESGGASGGSSEVGASSSMPGGMEESGGGGGGGGGGGSGGGGNRWPKQETLALLKIRSDMDVAFRDSSLKGPLWEEVSRKMAELGFQRSAKKCKEKFENVFKYHKRTKDGRASKSDGKTYRFFDQLEAFESTPPPQFTTPAPPRTTAAMAAPPPVATNTTTNTQMPPVNVTVSSISPNPISELRPNINPIINSSPFQQSHDHHQLHHHIQQQTQFPIMNTSSNPHMLSTSFLYSTSSSTSSDEDIQRRRGKKRKWKDFFQRLMKDVVHKQEELQKKFIDTLERRERDRMAREEAWRAQEISRLNREHELLVQERSIAAAKDAAVIAFLQKVTDQQNLQLPNVANIISAPPPPPPPLQAAMQVQLLPNPHPPPPQPQPSININPTPAPAPAPSPRQTQTPPPPVSAATPMKTVDTSKTDNGGGGSGDNSISGAGSSRWPKAEVQALIDLRTSLDIKYQENGPKGPLWEEISSAMTKMGYNRSSKRCKEKWENINKYFKKVKESNKKRPEDSKTCPYFHQLDALYKARGKHDAASFKPESNPMEPIMAQPEQQWPLGAEHPHPPPPQNPAMPGPDHRPNESENNDDHEDDDDMDDEDEEDEGEGYEIVANKQPSDAAE